jgi:cob(I)alamin adenosyltransferase
MAMDTKRYIQVYTGDGKGKTTAALGLSIRAAGHGLKTYIGQFMKGQHYGELAALRDNPCITIEQYGDIECIRRDQVTQKHMDQAEQGLIKARDAMLSGQYDLVVLDEINVTVWLPQNRFWNFWTSGLKAWKLSLPDAMHPKSSSNMPTWLAR